MMSLVAKLLVAYLKERQIRLLSIWLFQLVNLKCLGLFYIPKPCFGCWNISEIYLTPINNDTGN